MVRNRGRGLHAGCAEPHRLPMAGQQQQHACSPMPGITSGAGGWSGRRSGAFGEVKERNSGLAFLPLQTCNRNPATATAQHQPKPGFAPQEDTDGANTWIWRQVGSLLLPCPHGKEKGKESPTLGHLSGKASACSLDPGSREAARAACRAESPGRRQGGKGGGSACAALLSLPPRASRTSPAC